MEQQDSHHQTVLANVSWVQKAVPPGSPVQKSEAIPPDFYLTSRYVTACDESYQAFPCVSILQVTNAGLEGLGVRLPNSLGMFYIHIHTNM